MNKPKEEKQKENFWRKYLWESIFIGKHTLFANPLTKEREWQIKKRKTLIFKQWNSPMQQNGNYLKKKKLFYVIFFGVGKRIVFY